MLSFNNRSIFDLSPEELSLQVFNLSNFYKNSNICNTYVELTLCIAELLEFGKSDFSLSIISLSRFIKSTIFSHYEKNIVIHAYYTHLIEAQNKMQNTPNSNSITEYYKGIIEFLQSETIILNYKQVYETNNKKAIKKCICEINDKIKHLEELNKNSRENDIKKILNISLKELYFYQTVKDYI